MTGMRASVHVSSHGGGVKKGVSKGDLRQNAGPRTGGRGVYTLGRRALSGGGGTSDGRRFSFMFAHGIDNLLRL